MFEVKISTLDCVIRFIGVNEYYLDIIIATSTKYILTTEAECEYDIKESNCTHINKINVESEKVTRIL